MVYVSSTFKWYKKKKKKKVCVRGTSINSTLVYLYKRYPLVSLACFSLFLFLSIHLMTMQISSDCLGWGCKERPRGGRRIRKKKWQSVWSLFTSLLQWQWQLPLVIYRSKGKRRERMRQKYPSFLLKSYYPCLVDLVIHRTLKKNAGSRKTPSESLVHYRKSLQSILFDLASPAQCHFYASHMYTGQIRSWQVSSLSLFFLYH